MADSMPVFDSEHNNVGHLCSHSQKDPQVSEQGEKKQQQRDWRVWDLTWITHTHTQHATIH